MTDLKTWNAALGVLAPRADPDLVRAEGRDVLRRWQEAHRRYHTTRHLDEVCAAFDELAAAAGLDEGALAVGLAAAWYHDAVYAIAEPGGSERASADLAATGLGRLGVPPAHVDQVVALVLATVEHDLPVDDALAACFHDADLWILAAPQDRFDDYCRQVRDEYAALPAGDYARGRTAVLRPFLDRDEVYATHHARTVWTERARANLRRELGRLALG